MAKAKSTSKKKTGKKKASKSRSSTGRKSKKKTAKKSAKKKSTAAKKKTRSKRKSSRKSAVKKNARKADEEKDDQQQSGRIVEKMETKRVEANQGDTEIPEFDLNQQIRAPQRQASSRKRKKKQSPRPQRAATGARQDAVHKRRVERTAPQSSAKQNIIAQIVARDIQNLRKSSR